MHVHASQLAAKDVGGTRSKHRLANLAAWHPGPCPDLALRQPDPLVDPYRSGLPNIARDLQHENRWKFRFAYPV